MRSFGRMALWVMGMGLPALRAAAPADTPRIPELHGKTLAGAVVDLPGGLKGKVGVLVLGFSQASRDEATVWGKRLAADYHDSPQVAYYELPMLEDVPKLLRGFVLGRIADSVSDRGKPHFVAVTEHEAEWKAAAGFLRSEDAYVLVVDGGGTVRWKYEGAASDAVYAQVKEHVQALSAGQ